MAEDHEMEAPETLIAQYDDALVLPLNIIPGTFAVYGDGLLEGGVCDANGNLLAGQFRSKRNRNANRSCVRGYQPSPDDIEYRDEEVIFGGILVSHWGHMLVDATSRLWYLVSPESRGKKIVFVMFPGQEFPYQELFDLAGISQDRYEIITRPTKFKSIIVPAETSSAVSAHFTSRWVDFFDAVSANVEPGEFDKVYLSRTRFKLQNVIGEKYFEEYFKNRGYHVVYPEQLSITEQISLMAGAKSVATTMGTISHLALFAKPGTEFIILNRSQDIVSVQLAIDQLRGIDALYVDAYRNFLPEKQGNCVFLLAPSEPWNRMIKERFGESPDQEYMDSEFPRVALEYMKAWGALFSKRSKYRWIRNFDTRDLVRSVNLALNDAVVDVSSYPEPVFVEALRNDAALATTQYPTAARATSLTQRGGVLSISGVLETPEDADGTPLAIFLDASDIADDKRTYCKWAGRAEDGRGLAWEAEIDLLDLPVSKGKVKLVVGSGENATSYAIVVPRDIPVQMQPVIDSSGSLAVWSCDSKQNLRLEKSDDYPPEDILGLTWIDALDWGKDGLALSGHATVTAEPTAMPSVSLGIRCGEKTIWVAPIAYSEDAETQELQWNSVAGKAELAKALNGFASDEGAPIDMVFGFSRSGEYLVCSFGRKRKSGSIRHYRNDFIQLEAGSIAYPVERDKAFGFSIGEGEKLIRRIRVERGTWNDDAAVLDGTVESYIGKYLGNAFPIVVQVDEETRRIGEAKIVSKEPGLFAWHAELAQSEIISAFSQVSVQSGSWLLKFIFPVGDKTIAVPFGASRKSGTMPALKRKMFIDDAKYVEFAAKDAGNITLRIKETEPDAAEPAQKIPAKPNNESRHSVFSKIFRK
ncbi:MAG: glycosyltransferase family 61 protein [Eggerthellaceae bacterium]